MMKSIQMDRKNKKKNIDAVLPSISDKPRFFLSENQLSRHDYAVGMRGWRREWHLFFLFSLFFFFSIFKVLFEIIYCHLSPSLVLWRILCNFLWKNLLRIIIIKDRYAIILYWTVEDSKSEIIFLINPKFRTWK